MARVKVHGVCGLPLEDCLCDELADPFAPVVLIRDDEDQGEPDGAA